MDNIKYVEENNLFQNQKSTLAKGELKALVSGAVVSSDEDWSQIEDGSLDSDDSFIERKETLPNNPNIIFKPLDTFVDKPEITKMEKMQSEDTHLLLPFGKDGFQRTETGHLSTDWFNSVHEKPIENLFVRRSYDRKNTPSVLEDQVLFQNKPKVKKSSTGLHFDGIEENPDKFPDSSVGSIRKKDFLRQTTKAINKYAHKKQKKKLKMNKRLQEKIRLHEKQLHLLIETGSANKLADLLIKWTINLENKDSLGNTPLNIAVQNGNYEIAEILLKNGAYIDTQNHLGNTPLHFACTYNYLSVLKLLVNNGADQRIQNEKGNMPWEGI